ncbi:Z1 domain-containing protein [Agreia pratensis]|uniref:Type III restriction enzyme, res subunit n=1 Tax=Agreia pratensis TaxID=150121 RepID=A0A1X7KT23_9MICO|nr:Z1 domain-containing protein [Agreia pratensis]SMG44522.1 Type III restriction enzyme, res subunit [Agreia pratensis]
MTTTANDFDINDFLGAEIEHSKVGRLARQYGRITDKGQSTESIKSAVDAAIENIQVHRARSFVIYGEPQSGKTEMMIALTAALLDVGKRIIIVLTNDSVQLLEQNITRFQHSGLDPAPKNFSEILDPAVKITGRDWVIFSKKNQSDLDKLLQKISKHPNRVIIDDEADYATPNGKVNRAEKTRINDLVEKLIGADGIYIGVTATPARLDLNATFENENTRWVDFPPHPFYTGQDVFFPTTKEGMDNLQYGLIRMPDSRDDAKYLREALLSFLVNVAFLNLTGQRPGNYSLLIHTSGKKADHTVDYEAVTKIFGILADATSTKYEATTRELFDLAKGRYGDLATELTRFVLRSINQNNVVVMNSNSDRSQSSYAKVTTPAALFTVAIGGNIVSRGVTFDNLLSMFFTRDSAHKIQQDTYIQRARMFGSRGAYLESFELYIPGSLYDDWQRCFVFHKLSLRQIRSGSGAPLWLQDNRIQPATTASVKLSAVDWQSGEMTWEIFELSPDVEKIIGTGGTGIKLVKALAAAVGNDALPDHLVEFIENFSLHGSESVAVHPTRLITASYKTADPETITRAKGFIGAKEIERDVYPRAIHHLMLFSNEKGNARVYYKYAPAANDPNVNSRRLAFVGRNATV